MPVMLERWNDDKMDALDAKVGGLGAQMGELQKEMREERHETRREMRELRHEMRAGFERVDDRFEGVHRLMVQAVIGLAAAYLAGFAAVIGLIATQL
jgi:hypothetical protein